MKNTQITGAGQSHGKYTNHRSRTKSWIINTSQEYDKVMKYEQILILLPNVILMYIYIWIIIVCLKWMFRKEAQILLSILLIADLYLNIH